MRGFAARRVDRNKHQIQIPLPPKIDASVNELKEEKALVGELIK